MNLNAERWPKLNFREYLWLLHDKGYSTLKEFFFVYILLLPDKFVNRTKEIMLPSRIEFPCNLFDHDNKI